jgi:hypothetical protein
LPFWALLLGCKLIFKGMRRGSATLLHCKTSSLGVLTAGSAVNGAPKYLSSLFHLSTLIWMGALKSKVQLIASSWMPIETLVEAKPIYMLIDQPRSSSASRRSTKLRSMSVSRVCRSLRYLLTFSSLVQRDPRGVRKATGPCRLDAPSPIKRHGSSEAAQLNSLRRGNRMAIPPRGGGSVSSLQRRQYVVQPKSLRDTWYLAKTRMRFDGVHI